MDSIVSIAKHCVHSPNIRAMYKTQNAPNLKFKYMQIIQEK